MADLNGTWKATAAELGGTAMPGSLVAAIHLSISDNRYAARVSGVADKGTLTLNDDLVPHTMDITGTDGPNKGKTIRAIYRLLRDELVVCYNLGPGDYPETFTSHHDTQLFLVTYRRQPRS